VGNVREFSLSHQYLIFRELSHSAPSTKKGKVWFKYLAACQPLLHIKVILVLTLLLERI
jgi:hypothetical protein